MSRLDEIRELESKATKGPWPTFGEALMCSLDIPGECTILGVIGDKSISKLGMGENWGQNLRFIAASREAVPYLLALVESLAQEAADGHGETYENILNDAEAELEGKDGTSH